MGMDVAGATQAGQTHAGHGGGSVAGASSNFGKAASQRAQQDPGQVGQWVRQNNPGKGHGKGHGKGGADGAVAGAKGGKAETSTAGAAGGGGAVAGAASVSTAEIVAKLQALLEQLKALIAQMQGAKGGGGVVQQSGGAMPGCNMDHSQHSPESTQVTVAAGANAAPAVAGLTGGNEAQLRSVREVEAARTTRAEDHQYEQRVLDLVNQIRAQNGLGALRYNPILDSASESHNVQMVRSRTMAHINIGDGSPGDRLRAAGWNGAWGENVAVGQKTPEQVVNEWMASPTHRANILNASYTHIGVAYGTTSDGVAFWAQSFGA